MDFYSTFTSPEECWFQTIERYVADGGDVNVGHPESGWTLLHVAAEYRQTDAIRLLVQHGADINARDHEGQIPLHIAVDADIDCAIQSGHPVNMSTVSELINAGADERSRNLEGRTPRDVAACYGQEAIDLYDSLSRISSANEPTLDEFTARCVTIIKAAGFSTMIHENTQISIAEKFWEHRMVWKHFYISSGKCYHQRHNADFPERLVAQVQTGLESLRAKRRA